jgi:hypothetical protein
LTFDELEVRLFDAAHKIYELEVREEERNKLKMVELIVEQVEDDDDDDDEIQSELQNAMGLLASLILWWRMLRG